MKAFF
jgi:hypothetical protein